MSKVHPEVDGPRPQCFSPKAWQDWCCAEKTESASDSYAPSLHGYCSECTLAYQASMKQHGACAHPGTIFVYDEGLEQMVGIRPLDKLKTGE